jgi:hypothetical protein
MKVYVVGIFLSIHENRRMNPVEIVLRWGWEGKRENDGGGRSKISCKYVCISRTIIID